MGLGLTPGYRKALIKERLFFDIGLQISYAQRRDDYIGYAGHNYQPGLGALDGRVYVQLLTGLMVNL